MPEKKQNRLSKESSPYLLQHADNPVDWYPWGKEALEKAQKEDKLLLVSIGYSACHWCHVMEHESFENEEVSHLMNEHFVCVKVDREERPDVDQVYMNAVQLLTRSGGWPLNCFALPGGSPIYGGTYFPKEKWMQLLKYMVDIYKNDKQKVIEQAGQLKESIKLTEFIGSKTDTKGYSLEDVDAIFSQLEKTFDTKNGGLLGSPKFVMPTLWEFLLNYGVLSNNKKAKEQLLFTLDEIAKGGIYDHIGGGFARYSVDEKWFAPHFEKMLYDNAQLVSLYSHAYQWSKKETYKQVVYETVNFVDKELSSTDGGFYSSLDADSEGEEGKYYVWTKDEIKNLLGDNSDVVCDYYGIKNSGNWEQGKNILSVHMETDELLEKYELSQPEFAKILEESKNILLHERNKRIPPSLDDKILTSWNALMIKGLLDAYSAFNDTDFLLRAIRTANFIREKQTPKDYSLYRNYKTGKSSIPAFLDDYAAMIDALIKLYSCTFEDKWLMEAQTLTEVALVKFFDEKSSMFFYTNIDHQDLVVRKMEIADNVIPSSNSLMANNLLVLGKYLDNEKFLGISAQMLSNVSIDIGKYGQYYSNWASLLLKNVLQNKELVVVGTNTPLIRAKLNEHYFPGVLMAGSTSGSKLPLVRGRYVDGKTFIYVCKNNSCKLPVETVPEALRLLNE